MDITGTETIQTTKALNATDHPYIGPEGNSGCEDIHLHLEWSTKNQHYSLTRNPFFLVQHAASNYGCRVFDRNGKEWSSTTPKYIVSKDPKSWFLKTEINSGHTSQYSGLDLDSVIIKAKPALFPNDVPIREFYYGGLTFSKDPSPSLLDGDNWLIWRNIKDKDKNGIYVKQHTTGLDNFNYDGWNPSPFLYNNKIVNYLSISASDIETQGFGNNNPQVFLFPFLVDVVISPSCAIPFLRTPKGIQYACKDSAAVLLDRVTPNGDGAVM